MARIRKSNDRRLLPLDQLNSESSIRSAVIPVCNSASAGTAFLTTMAVAARIMYTIISLFITGSLACARDVVRRPAPGKHELSCMGDNWRQPANSLTFGCPSEFGPIASPRLLCFLLVACRTKKVTKRAAARICARWIGQSRFD